jgi:hypothetical protein
MVATVWPGWEDYTDGEPAGQARPVLFTIAVHRRGVAWNEARVPWRWHRRCRPQTSQRVYQHLIQRCRCGAIRQDHGAWSGLNTRRQLGV